MCIIIRAIQPIVIHIADKTSRAMNQNGLELRGTAGIRRKCNCIVFMKEHYNLCTYGTDGGQYGHVQNSPRFSELQIIFCFVILRTNVVDPLIFLSASDPLIHNPGLGTDPDPGCQIIMDSSGVRSR
jgi:hypothetical protein